MSRQFYSPLVSTPPQFATARIDGIKTLRDQFDDWQLGDYVVSKLIEAHIPIVYSVGIGGLKVFEGILYGAMKCINQGDSRDYTWTADAAALAMTAPPVEQ